MLPVLKIHEIRLVDMMYEAKNEVIRSAVLTNPGPLERSHEYPDLPDRSLYQGR